MQWQHEVFPAVMQVRMPLVLADESPTVFENFRRSFEIAELDWVYVEGWGTIPRRNSQYGGGRGGRNLLQAEPYYIVDGTTLTVYATGPAEARGQRLLRSNLKEVDLPTYSNPLLEVHPQLYVNGVVYQEAVSSRMSDAQLAPAAVAYQDALAAVRESESHQTLELP